MKRKFLTLFLAFVCAVCLCLGLSACDVLGGETTTYTVESAYAEAQSCGYNGTLEEFTVLVYGSKDQESLSVTDVEINSDKELIVTLSDETKVSLGKVQTNCIHSYGNWVVGEEATCTSMGYKYRTCAYCGDVEYSFTEALGHTYSAEAVYTTNYGHMYQCTACNQIITEPHTLDSSYVCTTCDHHYYSEGLEFTLNYGSGNVKIYSVSVGTCVDSNVVIPSIYNNYPVTAIDEDAFYYSSKIVSVFIPDSITTIGNNAFRGCSSLKNVTIANGVTSIASSMFSYCYSLESISLPDSITTIGSSAFYNCTSLKSINLPDSVTTIGSSAFYNCTSLKSINLPDSVTSIGSSTFSYCTALSDIALGSNVTSIGSSAFNNTEFYNNDDNWDNNVLYINNYFICAKTSISGGYSIKEGTTLVAGGAFYGCNLIKSIIITNSVVYICGNAFYNCTSLTSIIIPDSVTYIGGYAFNGCSSLLTLDLPNSVTYIGSGAFGNCTSLTNMVIPDSVTSIGRSTFAYCTALKSITIGNGVTSIGYYAFDNCTALESITIPDSVITIEHSAFNYCSVLSAVYFGGTKEECDEILVDTTNNLTVGDYVNIFYNATTYYYSASQPTDSGNYWYYDVNGNIAVW